MLLCGSVALALHARQQRQMLGTQKRPYILPFVHQDWVLDVGTQVQSTCEGSQH